MQGLLKEIETVDLKSISSEVLREMIEHVRNDKANKKNENERFDERISNYKDAHSDWHDRYKDGSPW